MVYFPIVFFHSMIRGENCKENIIDCECISNAGLLLENISKEGDKLFNLNYQMMMRINIYTMLYEVRLRVND